MTVGDILRAYQSGVTPQEDIETQQSTIPSYESQVRRDLSGGVSQTYTSEALQRGYGTSRFDTRYQPERDLEDVRAEAQSGFGKIANGVAKGGITAVATAANTVAGLPNGLLRGLFELATGLVGDDEKRNPVDAAINHEVGQFTQRMQDLSEQLFPNYKTNEERSEEYQRQFLRHTLTPNFIGDDFIKNFGFTIGAVVGGSVMSRGVNKLLNRNLSKDIMKSAVVASSGDAEATAKMKRVAEAIQRGNLTRVDGEALATNMKDIGKRLNRANSYSQLIGAGIAAAGEGTFEGLNIRKEFLDEIRRDAGDQLQEDYRKAYEDMIAENNPDYVIENGGIVEDETGRHNISVLNGDGQDELMRRQKELTANYQKMMAYADTQAERLASLTFALNLPILTASNTYQFGRMLSGGWKTARRAASLSGGVRAGIAPTANYKPRGSVASRTVFKSLGLAGSEAMEEMSQGFVSSGFKEGAKMRLASFTNDGYDANQISKYESWLTGLGNGGMDYLSDVKNWKEGWLGALTGLLGIPGRTWNGGIAEARRSAKEEYDIDSRLAEKLNSTVNSADFDSHLRGWVRHMKYDDDMAKAVQANDEYAWHTADDRQLISDIVMFADADRLDDYLDIVKSYKTVSGEEMDQLKNSLEWARNMSNEDVQKKIDEQAEKIIKKAEQYKEIYEAMEARIPLGSSKPYLNELVATALEIKAYEERFLNLFGEVFNMIDPVLKSMAEKDSKDNKYSGQELDKRLNNIRSSYERRLNSLIPEEDLIQEAREDRKVFDSLLDIAVGQKKELRQKLDDLRKLQDARALYYKKLQTLEGTNGQQKYEEQAATPEIVQAAAEAAHVDEVMQEFKSISDIKAAYFQKKPGKERRDFVNMLQNNSVGNAQAKEFVNMINTYNKLNRYVDSHKMSPENFPIENTVLSCVMSDVIRKAQSENDILTLPDSMFPDVDKFISRYSTVFVHMNDSTYEMMKRDLRAIVSQYVQGAAHTASRDTANPTPNPVPANPATTETPEGYDASQPASATPLPTAPGTPQPTPEPIQTHEAEPQQPAEQTGGTVATTPAGNDTVDDAMFSGEAAETPTSEVLDAEEKQTKHSYYRTSVPEVATGQAIIARDAVKGLNGRTREDLKKTDLSDFVNSHPQYDDVWNALNNADAFKAIALDVKVGDRIEFIIDPSFPEYEGKPQILMAKKKDDGTYQILTPLLTKTADYIGLAELREDIMEEYDAFINRNPGQLFVFSKATTVFAKRAGLIEYDFREDVDKPLQDIRAYDDIKDIAKYVFVDGYGNLRLVGDETGEGVDIPAPFKSFYDKKSNKEKRAMRGNFYLILPSGDEYRNSESSYIPIRLGFEHFRKGKIENNEYLTGIRYTVRELEDIIRDVTADNIEDEYEYVPKTGEDGKPITVGLLDDEGNPVMEDYEYTDDKGVTHKSSRQVQEPVVERKLKKEGQKTLMRKKLQQLGDMLDIHNLYFELGVYENVGPALRIIQDRLTDEQKQNLINAGEEVPEEKELTMRRPEQVYQDFLTALFAGFNNGKGLSVQVRFGQTDAGNRILVSKNTFDKMINAGVVTSNAKMLRPKGVDFYTEPYSKKTRDFFSATPMQTESMNKISDERAREKAATTNIDEATNKIPESNVPEPRTRNRGRRMVPLDNYPTYASENEVKLRDGLVQKMRNIGLTVLDTNNDTYGYVKNGKVYINVDKATADTPIHEYTHLWAEAIRKNNKREWNNIRSIMEKDSVLWSAVQAKYPELQGDDLAEEVLAHYSGRRGAERLRTEMQAGSSDEASVRLMIDTVAEALRRFWKQVADMLHLTFTKAEDIADAVLSDMLNGINPNDELSWTNDPTDSRFWVVRSENDLKRVIHGTSMDDSISPLVGYKYSELPKDIRGMLDIHGYTDDNFNHMPDLLKDRVLRCAGA